MDHDLKVGLVSGRLGSFQRSRHVQKLVGETACWPDHPERRLFGGGEQDQQRQGICWGKSGSCDLLLPYCE